MPVYHIASGLVELLEWGEGDELVVLLHAAAAGPHSLSSLAAALSQPGRRIVAPALDGYGATSIHDAADCLQANLQIVQFCLSQRPTSRRLLFGHSMGGLIALLAALEDMPIDAMALYEPIVISVLRAEQPDEDQARHWDRSILATVERQLAAGNAEAAMSSFINAWNETPWDSLPRSIRGHLVESASRLVQDMHDVSHCQPFAAPGTVRVPVLLLQGTRSPPITRLMSARLQSLLQCELTHADGCGHMGPAQAPAAIARAVSYFFAPIPRMN